MKTLYLNRDYYYTIDREKSDKDFWYHLDTPCGHYKSKKQLAMSMFHTHMSLNPKYYNIDHANKSIENQKFIKHYEKLKSRYVRLVSRLIVVNLEAPKEIFHKINNILRDDWNPIGFDNDLPRNEYQSYAKKVYEMLDSGADTLSLVFYLRHVENDII
jgi:hypothetical protein